MDLDADVEIAGEAAVLLWSSSLSSASNSSVG
jgi:hypothetical protein